MCARVCVFFFLEDAIQMTEWAHDTWKFLHTQSFFIDLHEHHGLAAQQAFVNVLLALPSQLPCNECRPHLAAFFRSDPPPKPVAYEPEDYVYAKYIWSLHNSVNRRLGKPEPTFAAVVDHYVNGRQDIACSANVDTLGASGASAQHQASAQHPASASTQESNPVVCGISAYVVPVVVCVAILILAVIVLCAVLDVRRNSVRSTTLK